MDRTVIFGLDGFERFETERNACIVSDPHIPEMEGLKFLNVVREEDDDNPFFLFTGTGSEEVASDTNAADVTDLEELVGMELTPARLQRAELALVTFRYGFARHAIGDDDHSTETLCRGLRSGGQQRHVA